MLTPAQPVESSISLAACGLVMSPLPMTGIVRTAATTRRMPARFTDPSKPCWRVRPCTMIAATPVSSSARARSGAVRLSSSHPRRILQVTGMRTALDHAANQVCGAIELRHHGRAPADLADLPHRTAHVDVNRSDAERFQHLRGICHLFGHRAKKLHGERGVPPRSFRSA